MNNFVFNNPTKIIFGKNTIEKIGEEIQNYGLGKVLLLYGKSSIFNNGVYNIITSSLKNANITWVELGGVKPNPVLSKVEEAISICKKEKVTGVIAAGGGSVIDTAKTVSAGVNYDGDVWDFFEGKASAKKGIPVFTVLTISATGSEMNPYAVITKENENKKWAFAGSLDFYPKVSIIDPTVQFTLPVSQTVNGAIDAISHVLELYFDGTVNTDIQNEISEGIIRTIIKHVKILINQPSNYESRSQLAWCATLALNGLIGVGSSGGDWSSHTLEHSLSVFTDIAHGAGLSIVLPAWMKYVYQNDIRKFARFAEKIFGVVNVSDDEKANRGIELIKKFFREIGAPVSLRDAGIGKDDIKKLTDNASIKTPVGKLKKLNKKDIENIFQLAF